MTRPDRRALDGYARFYAAFAVLTAVLSFQPLFARVDEDAGIEVIQQTHSLWNELAETGHETSVLAVLFFVVQIGLLAVGAFGLRSTGAGIGVAIGIAIAAVILVVMVWTKAGYRSDRLPELTAWGQIAVVLGIAGAVLAVANAVHLWILDRHPSTGSPAGQP